jgi:putative intracellular protease/amidase
MRRRGFVASGIAGVTIVAAAPFAILSLPVPEFPAPAPIGAEERARTIAALVPPKRARPVVAVVVGRLGGETTDVLIPFGVLARSGVAEVRLLGVKEGPVALMPALSVVPQATLDAFDAEHPDGADYVIVPAMHEEDAEAVAWIGEQAATGSTIIGVCEGVKLLGAAGLLDGRRATTHWHAIDALQEAHPTMIREIDRRYVVDKGVVTTTGVTASLPVSLALVEAIAGAERARALAADLGVGDYDARHMSAAFGLTARHAVTAAENWLTVWGHETIGVQIDDGADEIALAFVADAYSRTYRSHAVTVGARLRIRTLSGIEIAVDYPTGDRVDHLLAPHDGVKPLTALDSALAEIGRRYGERTAAFVALQLEYPWRTS